MPTRTWRNNAGPLVLSRTASAVPKSTGDRTTTASVATLRSKTALMTRPKPTNSGRSTCSSGRPATGRMCRRGPATSVRPGDTTRTASVPSSRHEFHRNFSALIPPDRTATVSARTPEPPKTGSSCAGDNNQPGHDLEDPALQPHYVLLMVRQTMASHPGTSSGPFTTTVCPTCPLVREATGLGVQKAHLPMSAPCRARPSGRYPAGSPRRPPGAATCCHESRRLSAAGIRFVGILSRRGIPLLSRSADRTARSGP